MSLAVRITCESTDDILNLLKLLVVNANDCSEWVDCDNASDSLESIVKRLVSELDDGRLALNVCFGGLDVMQFTPQAQPPANPQVGWVYVNTDNHIYYYNGASWVQLD